MGLDTIALAAIVASTAALQPIGDNSEAQTAPMEVNDPAFVRFQDCETCPEMLVMPEGRFVMGRTDQPPQGEPAWEYPPHEVVIEAPFAIGLFEVTVGQYRAFVDATGYRFRDGRRECRILENGRWRSRRNANYESPGQEVTEDHPAVCLNYVDAIEYTNWLSDITGENYRLATEAEWEYAARYGRAELIDARENWDCTLGNVADLAFEQAGGRANAGNALCDDNFASLAPVGSFAANPAGIFDMAGNAFEWVADCWHDSYEGAPSDGSSWTEPRCTQMVQRGGSWLTNVGWAGSTFRWRVNPGFRDASVGFRVVREIQPD